MSTITTRIGMGPASHHDSILCANLFGPYVLHRQLKVLRSFLDTFDSICYVSCILRAGPAHFVMLGDYSHVGR
jgi:hypothetical protein